MATERKGANTSFTPSSQFQEVSTTQERRSLSPLEQLEGLDLTNFRPIPPPAGNVSAFFHYSRPLQELVGLGVDLSRMTKRSRRAVEFVIRSDYDRDLLPIVSYLTDEVGMTTEECAKTIRFNPELLMDGVDGRIQKIVGYLRGVGFEKEEVCSILATTPELMTMDAKTIDKMLEHVQAFFYLTGSELRSMVVNHPNLLRMPYEQARRMEATLRRCFGLSAPQIHKCVTASPRILTQPVDQTTFNFLHLSHQHKLPLDRILVAPEVLTAQPLKLEERMDFLVSTERAQFDPTKPLFTSPGLLALREDADFLRSLPGTPVTLERYKAFLKSR